MSSPRSPITRAGGYRLCFTAAGRWPSLLSPRTSVLCFYPFLLPLSFASAASRLVSRYFTSLGSLSPRYREKPAAQRVRLVLLISRLPKSPTPTPLFCPPTELPRDDGDSSLGQTTNNIAQWIVPNFPYTARKFLSPCSSIENDPEDICKPLNFNFGKSFSMYC